MNDNEEQAALKRTADAVQRMTATLADHPRLCARMIGERSPSGQAATFADALEWLADWCDEQAKDG